MRSSLAYGDGSTLLDYQYFFFFFFTFQKHLLGTQNGTLVICKIHLYIKGRYTISISQYIEHWFVTLYWYLHVVVRHGKF